MTSQWPPSRSRRSRTRCPRPCPSPPAYAASADAVHADDKGYRQPEVDVAALRTLLDGRYAEVRDLVRANLAEHAQVLVDEEQMTTADFRERVKDVVVMMAGTGQTGMGFPEEYGGGGDIGASIAAFETLAMGDLSVLVKVGVQFGLFGGAILQLGTKTHHDAYLADLVSGRTMGCFAMTESGHGSNVQALGTVATYDPATEEFVITTPDDASRKDYIGNAAAHAELAAVFAQLEVDGERHGVHAFVVPIRSGGQVVDGVRIEDCGPKMGLNGVDNGRIWFDGVRVPRTALLNQFAEVTPEGRYLSPIDNPNKRFFTMLGTLVQGRVCVGGAGHQRREGRADHRHPLRRAPPPVRGDLARRGAGAPRLRHAPAPAAAARRADVRPPLRAGGRRRPAARRLLRPRPDRGGRRRARPPDARVARRGHEGARHLARDAAPSRSAARPAAVRATSARTGSPPSRPTPTSSPRSRATTTSCCSWSPRACSPTTPASSRTWTSSGWPASWPGSRSRRSSSAPRCTSSCSRCATCCPAATRWDQEAGLLDPNYQLAMLRFREEHMIGGVARRLKRGIDQGANPGAVFSRVQDHVIAAARAHAERLVLEAFVAKAAELPDGDLKVTVNLLCDLHALSTIEADRAWFMEHGRLSSARSKAISREVGSLCRKIRPLAVDLVDAFGVPEEMLRSPELLTWTDTGPHEPR